MDTTDLARQLHRLRRTVLMLQTELRREHMDEPLLDEIEARMENGIAFDPRCERLTGLVDALRETLLTPRPELYGDGVRACERLKDAIEEVLTGA